MGPISKVHGKRTYREPLDYDTPMFLLETCTRDLVSKELKEDNVCGAVGRMHCKMSPGKLFPMDTVKSKTLREQYMGTSLIMIPYQSQQNRIQ